MGDQQVKLRFDRMGGMSSWKVCCIHIAGFVLAGWINSTFPDFSHWTWPVIAVMLFLFGIGKLDPLISFISRNSQKKKEWNWLRQEYPNCTFNDLHNYLDTQLVTVPARLEVDAEVMFGFRLLSEFLSQKLFEGKVKAWGKEIREGKVSPKETLIPREYWEFNRLDLEESAIDMHSAEEIIYTSLRFNQKRMIEQMEFLFSNYEKIQEQLRKTERYTKQNEEQYWVEL